MTGPAAEQMERINIVKLTLVVVFFAVLLCSPVFAPADEHEIDTTHSVIKVFVYKTGFLAAFAHDHVIAAPISQGVVEIAPNPRVELLVKAAQLRVLDPELPAEKRLEIQEKMEGAEVLDSLHFPEILLRSTGVMIHPEDRWTVRGELTLHGETRPVTLEVTHRSQRFVGSTTLNQSDFGIIPVSIAGGTVRVKNQVRIEFEVLLVK